MRVAMDFNLKRRAFEQAVAADVAAELFRALGPGIPIADHSETVCRVFGAGLDRHQITTEAAAARILGFVPKYLADLNRQRAEFNRQLDAAIRQDTPNTQTIFYNVGQSSLLATVFINGYRI
jgi:hypothetical protein